MLEVQSLTCERDQRVLFENLNFTCEPGEIVQVEGPNGAGKSTLLKILCGIFDEYTGDVTWYIEDAPLYLGHRPGVTDQMSVAENLQWLAGLHHQSLAEDDLEKMLAAVGLAGYEEVAAGNLSEGQRKRVSLARFFGFTNRVWILDEPFSAIDTAGVTTLEMRLQEHARNGGLVLLTSHQPLDLAVPVRRLSVGAG
jgi:heme exporter protein A